MCSFEAYLHSIKIQQSPQQLFRMYTNKRYFQDVAFSNWRYLDLPVHGDNKKQTFLIINFIFKFSMDNVPLLLSVLRENHSPILSLLGSLVLITMKVTVYWAPSGS